MDSHMRKTRKKGRKNLSVHGMGMLAVKGLRKQAMKVWNLNLNFGEIMPSYSKLMSYKLLHNQN